MEKISAVDIDISSNYMLTSMQNLLNEISWLKQNSLQSKH